MCINTARLRIRAFRPTDGADLYEYLSQPETVRFEPHDAFSRYDADAEARRRASDTSFHAVCLKPVGTVIGNLYLAEREFDTWELGYVFNSRHTGKGLASEAVRAVLDDLFTKGVAHRVIAMCTPENIRSWHLLERIGFRREGHLVRNVWFRRSVTGVPLWQDTYEYALLATEWRR